jgi:hypothetical protein
MRIQERFREADPGKHLLKPGVFSSESTKLGGEKGRLGGGLSLYKNWQIFFDNVFGGPIISATGFVFGCIGTGQGIDSSEAHLGEA